MSLANSAGIAAISSSDSLPIFSSTVLTHGSRLSKRILQQYGNLGLAVACGLKIFSTIGVKLGFCGLKLGADDYIIDADYPIETYF